MKVLEQIKNKNTKIILYWYYIPKIILAGAHTSIKLFLRPLITQWYLKFWPDTQFWCCAIILQFFLLAAASHSVFEVGQDVTIFTLSTASWQYIFWLLSNCCRKGIVCVFTCSFTGVFFYNNNWIINNKKS